MTTAISLTLLMYAVSLWLILMTLVEGARIILDLILDHIETRRFERALRRTGL